MATTLYEYRCSGMEEFAEEPQEAPSVCEWAGALDLIVLAEIESVESNYERYSVDLWALEKLAPLIRDNGLESEFPWLDEVLVVPPDQGRAHELVASCPDGLRAEVERGMLTMSAQPAITMKLRQVGTLFGDWSSNGGLEFFTGLGGGLWVDEDGQAQRDGVLQNGTLIGVGLTAAPEDRSVMVQGNQVPFTASNGVVIARQPCTPKPPFPKELNGMAIEELQHQLQSCGQGGARSEQARATREGVLSSCFSGETGSFCHAARCVINYSGELTE